MGSNDDAEPADEPNDEVEPVGPGFTPGHGDTKRLRWTIGDDPITPDADGNQPAWYGDVAIRRAHVIMFGELFPRVLLMMHFGINMFVYGHNAKVTLEYRNRPIFDASGTVQSRKGNGLVLQIRLFI